MRWLSFDPAALTGLCQWDGYQITSVATLRAPSKPEVKRHGTKARIVDVLGWQGPRMALVFADECQAWGWVLSGVQAVIGEEGFGPSPKTIKQHAFRRGFVAGLCAMRSLPFHEVNVSEWRKVVGDAHGFTFPRQSDEAKARAIELVEARFRTGVSDDEADAACAGLWALQTRTVRP